MKSFRQSTTFLKILIGSFIFSNCASDTERAPSGFFIQDGYQLTLVAAEPLIKDPVDIEFDEHGHTYVLEMPGYPYEDSLSRIVLLKDKDLDGDYESSSIFASGLELASSIMPYDQGILVAAPPYLLHVRDTDQDDKADQRDTLMGGFSTGNLQHNYNGLTFGIDGWIYAANGGNSGQPYWWGDMSSKIELGGDDFRINIDQKKIEKIGPSSGGFELGIDEWGEVLGTHNLEHVNQIVYPRKYGKLAGQPADITFVNISNHDENGLSRIYPVGEQESRVNHPEQSGYFSGACGITYYNNGSLGSELENSIWVADVVLNLVHVDHVYKNNSIKGASRLYDHSEFLTCTDRSFRPVNLTIGPDGSMYVVDMYRKVIEHPEWIPDEIEKTLDLDAGKDKGRIYRIRSNNHDRSDQDIFVKVKSPLDRVALLLHHNQWVRNTAHRLIVSDDDQWVSIRENLMELLSSENHLARFHALHILNYKKELTPGIILTQLDNDHPEYLKGVIQLAEQFVDDDEAVRDKILQSFGRPELPPRMQAALSLSMISSDAKERISETLKEKIVSSLNLKNDQWSLQALALASKGLEADIFNAILEGDIDTVRSEFLTLLTQSSIANIDGVEKIVEKISTADLSADIKHAVVESIASNLSADDATNSFKNTVRALDSQGNTSLLSAIQHLRSNLGLPSSSDYLTHIKQADKTILDKAQSVEERLAWLSLLRTRPYSSKSNVLSTLLNYEQPEELQIKALEQLWESDDPSIGSMLVDKWDSMSPNSRRTASDILLYKELHHDALLTGLENENINIGEMNFDLERRRTLLWWTDNETTKSRAEALFSDSGVVTRQAVIADMKNSLSLQGNVEDGLAVFDQLCSQCHVYGDKGYEVGPSLTEISRKSKESLIHDILDPNAAVDSKYINHKLTLDDGQVHLGIIYSEDDSSVSLKKMTGVSVEIPKSDIVEFRSLGTSFMMEGLEANLDHQSMADLLSFLQKG